jgi:hypothetical protein
MQWRLSSNHDVNPGAANFRAATGSPSTCHTSASFTATVYAAAGSAAPGYHANG